MLVGALAGVGASCRWRPSARCLLIAALAAGIVSLLFARWWSGCA